MRFRKSEHQMTSQLTRRAVNLTSRAQLPLPVGSSRAWKWLRGFSVRPGHAYLWEILTKKLLSNFGLDGFTDPRLRLYAYTVRRRAECGRLSCDTDNASALCVCATTVAGQLSPAVTQRARARRARRPGTAGDITYNQSQETSRRRVGRWLHDEIR